MLSPQGIPRQVDHVTGCVSSSAAAAGQAGNQLPGAARGGRGAQHAGPHGQPGRRRGSAHRQAAQPAEGRACAEAITAPSGRTGAVGGRCCDPAALVAPASAALMPRPSRRACVCMQAQRVGRDTVCMRQERRLPDLASTPLRRPQRWAWLRALPRLSSGAATFVGFAFLLGTVAALSRARPMHKPLLVM